MAARRRSSTAVSKFAVSAPTWSTFDTVTPLFGEAHDRPPFDRFAPPNWLGAENPHNLQRPALAWLLKVWNYDPELRILPGITQPCYRVARRTHRQLLHKPVLGNDSETGRMCRERLIPVVSLIPTIKWNDDFLQWLADHDTWAFTNAYRDVADCVEDVERAEEDRVQRALDDDGTQRGISAWAALKQRTGQRVFVHEPAWSLNASVTEPSAAQRGPQSGDNAHGDQPVGGCSSQAASPCGDA